MKNRNVTTATRAYIWCGLLAVLTAATASAAPRLTIKENEFRFGFVPQNSSIAHPFWLYSTGDDTLKILRVNPG